MHGTEPSEAQLAALETMAQGGDDGPFTMVNIIKYKDQAIYPEGYDGPACTGREAYAQYTNTVGPLIYALGGSVAFQQDRELLFVGDATADADEVIIVNYPSRKAYLNMFYSPAYQGVIVHRMAGLVSRVLYQCTAKERR
ncbi:DUF1330 domain-containing protein [Pseudomonadales bacterium]|jgi:uncharacterized protein (DUF1330 family)|nr:DUF1330 domain-containing protein [Pseudomonadales bacterium]